MPVPPKRTGSTPPRRASREAPPAVEPDADSGNATARALESAPEDDGEHTVPGSADATISMTNGEAANATVVFDTNKGMRKEGTAAGPPSKLIVNKGPKQGAEFTLGPGETSIGRNNDNTIVIPDISVSRKHVVLVKQAGGYLLQDQGSGNGTLLNGNPVGEQMLKDGDVFSIGDTEIQFSSVAAVATMPRRASAANPVGPPKRGGASRVAPVPAPRAARRDVGSDEDDAEPESTGQIKNAAAAGGKRKPPLVAIAAVMGVLLLLGFGWKWKQNRIADDLRREQEAEDEKKQKDAVDVFRGGKELAQKGNWSEALAKFTEAKGVGLSDPELEDYISRANKELGNQKLLADAQTALDAHNLSSAFDAAGKVPNDSLLSDKADELKKKVKDAIPERLKTANGLISTKGFDEATKILADVEKVDPSNADLQKTQDALAAAQNQKAPVHVGSHIQAVDHSSEVKTAFNNGDLKTAKELAAQYGQTDDKIKVLGSQIADFETAFASADSDAAAADKASKLDRTIGGGKSVYTKKLNTHAFSKNLKDGLEAKSAGNLVKAYALLRSARDVDPSNAECNAALGEIKSKAHEIYMDAYTEKGDNPEDAKAKFNQVIHMTPADDENHVKAVARLQELGN